VNPESVDENESTVFRFDRELASVMFAASLLFLILLGGLLHISDGDFSSRESKICLRSLLVIYLAFPLEMVLVWLRGGKFKRLHWYVLLIPPLRLATADHESGTRVWLPFRGWRTINKSLVRELDDFFSWPMIVLALLVLPLIGAEFLWADKIEADHRLRMAFQTATAMIWAAFVVEFVVMFSVTENKLRYAIRHWLDLVVICLPLIAFLRALRLAQLLRLNQVSRTVRLYRMRGVLIRTWRAIVAMDVLERIFVRNPAERIARLERALIEKESELDLIRGKIEKLKARLASVSPAEINKVDDDVNEIDLERRAEKKTDEFHAKDSGMRKSYAPVNLLKLDAESFSIRGSHGG
jgi:hypothetical protein